VVVSSFKSLRESPPGASSSRKTPPVEFDIIAVRVPLQASDNSGSISPLEVLWHRRGSRVPFYTAYEKRRGAFILAGGSPYRQIGQPAPENHDPSPDEFAPIPRADDASAPTSPPKPPPYAWTQDSEEITVAFPLPSTTPKTDINVLFSPQTLTLLVQGCDAPRYTAARLWGGIVPASSFWTWDAHGARTYGLLTLHLEKQHAGTRWPHLFDSSNDASAGKEAKAEHPEVPETLDPSELYAIRESLEKYTAALQERAGAGAGVAPPPSLTDGELDAEVDAAVGIESCITWVAAADGGSAGAEDLAWTREDWDVPFTTLSAPLPGIGDEISLVVKHTIDGVLFVLSDEDTTGGTPVWTHSSTFSALAFVLASKRDTRFTYHVPSKAVLAFEGGGPEYAGNLYIYRDAKPKSNWAKQAILKLAGSTSGSLLGVGTIKSGEEVIILCLCEEELLVLRNVL
jgi:CS domain